MTTLRLVLGDQLNRKLSALQDLQADDRVLLMEVWDEATYVKHHPKKIAFLFSAMRHFAQALRQDGVQVDYIKLDDEQSQGSFSATLQQYLTHHSDIDHLVTTEASEYRVLQMQLAWAETFQVSIDIRPDDRFFCSKKEFIEWARGRNTLLMETFYRKLRKSTQLLMEGDEPVGGQWNYDKLNRKPALSEQFFPKLPWFEPDEITREVLQLVSTRFDEHFGQLQPFGFAVTRKQALQCLDAFIENGLTRFGTYQDAMLVEEPYLYHSLLSFYLNAGLLLADEVCERVQQAFYDGAAPINAVEGYIRQILGWREYIRGVYWLKMPDYETVNFFETKRDLPAMYWGQPTKLRCVSEAVAQTDEHAYSHHIQRLMITGNFALLIGVEPQQVHQWYLEVYADAYEWVELPNTLGMSQFADGGLLGSKPYASSGAYINKMSNFCKHCDYKVSKKNGEEACPFNYLYWHFLHRNQQKLRRNPRLSLAYRTLERFDDEKLRAIYQDSERFLAEL